MGVGEAIAIAFAAASTAMLVTTFYLLRKSYREKMEEAARVLGVAWQVASELEQRGRLPGALALGQPVVISAKALETLLDCKAKDSR